MLEDAAAIRKVVIACGYVDLSIPIKMSTFFGNSEHPFPEK